MVSALALMVILVFGNVILRYFFNSGITWSEEMSRYLFVWLTFFGAIGAYKNKEHLGVDLVVRRLPRGAKKFVNVISDLIILYILYLILDGSWKMTLMNMDSVTPAIGMSLSLVYGTGILVGVSMGVITLHNLYRILFNKVTDEELNPVSESEEILSMHAASIEKEEIQG